LKKQSAKVQRDLNTEYSWFRGGRRFGRSMLQLNKGKKFFYCFVYWIYVTLRELLRVKQIFSIKINFH